MRHSYRSLKCKHGQPKIKTIKIAFSLLSQRMAQGTNFGKSKIRILFHTHNFSMKWNSGPTVRHLFGTQKKGPFSSHFFKNFVIESKNTEDCSWLSLFIAENVRGLQFSGAELSSNCEHMCASYICNQNRQTNLWMKFSDKYIAKLIIIGAKGRKYNS